MIDLDADRPVWRQLADLLRESITSGDLPVGARVPGELRLAQEHGVSRTTVIQALEQLRREALVVTRAPYGTRVRADGSVQVVSVQRPSDMSFRQATPADCRRHDIDESVTVVEVRTGGYEPVTYVAMCTRFTFR